MRSTPYPSSINIKEPLKMWSWLNCGIWQSFFCCCCSCQLAAWVSLHYHMYSHFWATWEYDATCHWKQITHLQRNSFHDTPKDSSHNIPYFLFSCLTSGTSAWGRWLCTCWNRAKNAAHGASGWHPVWDAVGLQLAGSCPLYSFLVASRINPSRPALTSHLPSQTALWLEGNQTRLTPGRREKKSCIFMHIQDIVKRFAILLSFKNLNIFIVFYFFIFMTFNFLDSGAHSVLSCYWGMWFNAPPGAFH